MDYHLHEFRITLTKRPLREAIIHIGIPSKEDADWGMEKMTEWETHLDDWFPTKVKQAVYTYDFGDSWDHTVLFEKELTAEVGQKYPCCIAGKRACPPEDCGNIPGYERVIKIMANPKHKEHRETVEWLNLDSARDFDPEHFDPSEVEFDNPRERLKEVLAHKDEY